jgi:hypothetical protein
VNDRERIVTSRLSGSDTWEGAMRRRVLGGIGIILAAAFTSVAAGGHAPLPGLRQSAVTYLTEPTLIGSTFVVGPVVFTHDNAKMAHAEPCTTVYLFDPRAGRATEEVASFHCLPRTGPIVTKLTTTTRPSTLGFGCVLTSYQFAGDPEVHGVPEPLDAQ